jgi:hypothetical protein
MRPIVAVDLAAKFSAGVLLDPDGNLTSQWDSFNWSHGQVAQQIFDDFAFLGATHPDEVPLVVIEDLPQHVPSSAITKSVAQLQGRILQIFDVLGQQHLDSVFWVPPAVWQQGMGVWQRGSEAAEFAASALGYKPPDLVTERGYKPGQRGYGKLIREAEKQQTDYVDAFLIAAWARMSMERGMVWDSRLIRQYR